MAEASKESQSGFFIHQLDVGFYSVRLSLFTLVQSPGMVRHLHHWLITRSPEDRILLYLEDGATPSVFGTGGWTLVQVANIFKAIQLCPAYDNLMMIISQMLTGVASYLILATKKTKWSPLGFVSFDGWMSDKAITEYDVGVRSDILWVKNVFRKGVSMGLFSEEQVKDHEDGRMVIVRCTK